MNNPFEPAVVLAKKQFSIMHRGISIKVSRAETYRLTWPNGRWVTMDCREDYSSVTSSSNEASRQVIPCSWIILETSGGPAWINQEQLQVMGELLRRKSVVL